MQKENLIVIFSRELNKLKTEIEAYKDENNLWLLKEGISNCAGNLCLHLIGNLNHFIGAVLGNTGYVRERELEFSLKNVPKTELIKQIDDVINVVENTLSKLSVDDFQTIYTAHPRQKNVTTELFLMHLITHLSYHLGQINYHRRLLDI